MKILLINPGASLTGGPILFLNTIKWFKKNKNYDCTILSSQKGPLESEFGSYYPTYNWNDQFPEKNIYKFYFFRFLKRIFKKISPFKQKTYSDYLIKILTEKQFDLIYANTVASADILITIKKHIKCKTIMHIRELEISIYQFCGIDKFHDTIPLVDRFIADSESVKSNLVKNHSIDANKIITVFEYISIENAKKVLTEQTQKPNILKEELNISSDAFIVVSAGTTDWRKGVDLVVQIAAKVHSPEQVPIHFVWIGGSEFGPDSEKLMYDVNKLKLGGYIHFIGTKANPLNYFFHSDVFMLCSREEPVGIVALEAASLGKPILCYEGAGGMSEFVEDDCGFIVPYLNTDAMAERILELFKDEKLKFKLGKNASEKVKRHDINIACEAISEIIESL